MPDIVGLIVAIGSGGLIGGIVALYKMRPEAGQITVSAAQGALIVQTGVIDTLRFEIKRLTEHVDALEKENENCSQRLRAMSERVDSLEQERRLRGG